MRGDYMPEPKPVGKILHFYPKISVAVVEILKPLKVGCKVRIEGHGDSFEQEIASMQIEHEAVKEAKKGQSVGMKIDKPVKEGYVMYLAE